MQVGCSSFVYLSQHRLSCELNLPRCLSLFPTPFTDTYSTSVSQFYLIFDGWERAGAVMREVYASKGARAKVVRAVG